MNQRHVRRVYRDSLERRSRDRSPARGFRLFLTGRCGHQGSLQHNGRPTMAEASESGALLEDAFAATSFGRPLRRYQQLALDAFERQRTAGRKRAYLVLPPGAGKTVLGLEAIRRLGQRALCLCPNTAVQARWVQQWSDFAPLTISVGSAPSLDAPLTVLTYQSLCSLDTEPSSVEPGHYDERARTLLAQAARRRTCWACSTATAGRSSSGPGR